MTKISTNIPELPSDFNWKHYILLNEDIKLMGITTLKNAVKHYLKYGKYENRKYKMINYDKNDKNLNNYLTDNYNFPKDFNWEYYVILNPDLGDINKKQAIKHFITNGRHENRKYKLDIPIQFDWRDYITMNPDLGMMTKRQALSHYFNYGKNENRKYKPTENKPTEKNPTENKVKIKIATNIKNELLKYKKQIEKQKNDRLLQQQKIADDIQHAKKIFQEEDLRLKQEVKIAIDEIEVINLVDQSIEAEKKLKDTEIELVRKAKLLEKKQLEEEDKLQSEFRLLEETIKKEEIRLKEEEHKKEILLKEKQFEQEKIWITESNSKIKNKQRDMFFSKFNINNIEQQLWIECDFIPVF